MEPKVTPNAESELLNQAQCYLTHRGRGLPVKQDLEAAWMRFYDFYSRKIRTFAYTRGAKVQDVGDCLQEVWAELLVHLPTFHLNPSVGTFDTWLFQIVRSKTVDLSRSRKHCFVPRIPDSMRSVVDGHPGPVETMEAKEIVAMAWGRITKRLSKCNCQVLQMRLLEGRPVAEVAERLGLSEQQVWYRYHRARRELEGIGTAWSRDPCAPAPHQDLAREKTQNRLESAQGKSGGTVSRNAGLKDLIHQG
jgi:RNA polymerase sigma factor (sigma-70 family)